MTQSTQTNGASLEDCHTNFFALTDLCGIRWRVYTGATSSCGGMNGGFGGSSGGDPLEDPVLVSYARCLNADVLCVWRRTGRLVPTRGQPPSPNPGGGGSGLDAPLSSNPPPSNPPVRSLRESPKELWVFWYGDEPDLSQLVAPELTKGGEYGEDSTRLIGAHDLSGEEIKGSWDWETGLSYECRTLLFKALHNLIERCLLTRDFVRLGRWFVQPYEGPEGNSTNKSTHLSFSLSFFFHGESTVCASVDVRQHPPVRRLQRHHLVLAQQSSQGIPVILGPYGLSGTLTGIGYRISEPSTQKLLQEWKQFFPVETKMPQKESPEASVPAVVEVVVGGHKMRYPSCYVLVTDLDDYLLTSRSGGMVSLGGSSPQSMKGSSLVEGVTTSGGQEGTEEPAHSTVKAPPTHNSPFMASTHTLLVPGYLWSGGKNQGAAHQLSERVWQDVVQCPGQQTPQHDGLTPEGALTPAELASQWDFADPAVKINCSCSKCANDDDPGGCCCRCRKGRGGNSKGWSVSKGRGEKERGGSSKPNQRGGGGGSGGSSGGIPWHHRQSTPPSMAPLTPAAAPPQLDQFGLALDESELLHPANRLVCVGTPGGGSTSGLQGLQGSGVATPGSVPSLRLTGTNDGAVPSVESPASVAPSPLPTPMSQPASVPHNDPMMPTLSPHPPASNQSIGDPTTPATVESHDTKFNVGDLMGPKSVPSVCNQGMSPFPNGERSGNDASNPSPASSHHQPQQSPQQRGLKRPSLPGKEYQSLLDEDEDDKSSLYDYTKLNAWLHHPVKRFKPAEPKVSEPFWPPYRPSHITERMDIVKTEPEVNGLPVKRIAIKREADPYDFEDDAAALANGPSGGGGSGGTGGTGAVSGSGSTGGGGSGSSGSSNNSSNSSNGGGGGNNSSGGGSGTGSGGGTSGSAGGTVSGAGSGGGPGGGSGTESGGSGSATVKRKEEPKDESAKPVGSVKSSHYPHSPSQTKKTSSLFTSEGLQASLSDLDEIFESDSPVEESQFPDHTPPSSNKPSGGPEDTAAVKSSSISKSTVATSLPELTTMFPTPPSHEHNPDHETEEATPQLVQVKQEKMELVENYTEQVATGVTIREDQRDWNTVYKPPSVAMFVGSPRYAPLTNLPSQQEQPPVVLPPDCVYKPSWQYNMGEKGPGHLPMGHMGPLPGGPASAGHAVKVNLSPISPAPSSVGGPMSVEGGPGSHRGPGSVGNPPSAGPPMNYELASPVSNQSSYLNKILPSVEPPCASGIGQMHEASSLIVNLVLQDSSINLFRDHNFDSCTMCVCNTRQKVVGNIRGGDGTIYLHPSHLSNDEESITCNCGFSAVVNRRLAYQSGLFYEDEVDLTGLHEALVNERKKQSLLVLLDNKNSDNPDTSILDQLPQTMFELLQSQCLVTLSTTCSVIHRAANVYQKTRQDIVLNMVDYSDGNEMGSFALEQARASCENSDVVSVQPKQSCMHKWTYYQFDGPGCSEDIGRCMKALQPLMQEAIQKKRSKRLWDPVYNVTGPLTWRQFHRMAVRGTEDMAEPLPVPMFLTGHDRDWFSIAPQSVRHWEKMLLEPYSQPRNIAYVVVSPDNEFILNHVRSFFKELSSIYELCKLGRHAPIQKVLRDGIMRVSKTAAAKVANEPLDDWFNLLGDSQISTKLKVYAQVCRHRLAPHLLTLNLDKSLFEVAGAGRNSNSTNQVDRQAPSPMPPPSSSGDGLGASSSQSSNTSTTPAESESYTSSTPSGFGPGASLVEQDEDESPPPAIVVYLVDPFSLGHDHPDMHRLITLGLIRCYKHMLEGLPAQMHSNVYVQVVSLESILELAPESRDRGRQIDQFKTLAFSVFSQCRRSLTHTSNVKSLTGFGPASVYDTFLKPKDPNAEEKKEIPYHMFSPAYILAPIKESRGKLKEAEEALGPPPEKSTVLNCTYCLSEDQRWILAVATDELGELLETVTINIEIPNRTRRKKASARRYGLKKLMEWILSVMSVGVYPWRLVVGRLGRMGHGELKGWSSLLSRKSLIQASKNLKEMCKQCAYLYPGDAPCILSACVVSLEADSALRMMPDVFTPDERFGQNSQNCTLSTPQDVSCTHILVFPTSATTQSAQRQFQDENFHLNGDDLLNMMTEDFETGTMGDIGMGGLNISDILGLDTGPIQDDQMDDIGGRQDSQSQPGSPTSGVSGRVSPSQFSGQAKSNGVVMVDPNEDASAQVLQQPLALGYYVSTASTGRLPRWFWSACPHLETSCPAFLKSALHLHSPAITQSEDLMHSTNNKVHALDSSLTTDVLRYVLEGYNSLSWLVLDPATQDRRSCLPLHMQVLSHLYNVMAALV